MNKFCCFECKYNLDYIESKYNQCEGCGRIICDGCKSNHHAICELLTPTPLIS